MNLWLDAALAASGGAIGCWASPYVYRRRRPEIMMDRALTEPACPGCGGEMARWSSVTWLRDAQRYEQQRSCGGCGLTQRRAVPR